MSGAPPWTPQKLESMKKEVGEKDLCGGCMVNDLIRVVQSSLPLVFTKFATIGPQMLAHSLK